MKVLNFMSALAAFAIFLLGIDSETLLAQHSTADSRIAHYERLLRRNPLNPQAYYGLGDALIRKARESGDPAYSSRAEKALKGSLKLAPQNAGAMRHLAYVFYSRHDFDEASIHAKKAIEIDSTDGNAYAILGDSLLETGQYEQAEETYREMMRRQKNLYSYSRLAGLKTIRGDTAGAIAGLERAIATGRAEKQPAESIAWAEWQLGNNYFAIGELEKAERYYLQSLATYPDYYRAFAGMAKVHAAQKRYNKAIETYKKTIAILPMPEYAAALGDVYMKIGEVKKAKQQYDLVEYIGRLNQALYNRELAYFYTDHDIRLAEGLELAKRELDYRKDIYAYDLLAWSFYKNGQAEAARDTIGKALKLGTVDAKLFYHAGMIYQRLGELEKAKGFLARALAINPHFHVLHSETARRALSGLEKSSPRASAEREGLGG